MWISYNSRRYFILIFYLYFLFFNALWQRADKWPRWKHLLHALVHFFRIFQSLFLLNRNIFVFFVQEGSENSHEKTFCMESISNILVAALCFAHFFRRAGSTTQENVILFFKFHKLPGTTLMYYNWFYNIQGLRETVLYANFVQNFYSSTFW